MTLKEMSDVSEKLGGSESDNGVKVRCALPMRTLRDGWRSVRPICLPVQYSSRHLPGRNSSQFCALQTREDHDVQNKVEQ